MISIQYDSTTGKVTNKYYGEMRGDEWVEIPPYAWPVKPQLGENEIDVYYFDPNTREISVRVETVEITTTE